MMATHRWIQTASGGPMDLRLPRPDAVTLDHVSHSLAQINRFTGHARRPYSVAEHSLLVAEVMQRLLSADPHAILAALLHDAHEAYIGDATPAVKAELGEPWAALEERMARTVRSAWALHSAAHTWRAFVKQADTIALATERAQLMPRGGDLWPELAHVQPVSWVDLMSAERQAMTWADWRDRFKDAVDEADYARNDALFPVAEP